MSAAAMPAAATTPATATSAAAITTAVPPAITTAVSIAKAKAEAVGVISVGIGIVSIGVAIPVTVGWVGIAVCDIRASSIAGACAVRGTGLAVSIRGLTVVGVGLV
jgi:hypothetical protein